MDELVDYCRRIETYLCQKNGGHLVRIVGPAFETVRGWADQGVPLKVAFLGIDRCLERAQARGGRRRPMRVEFCEADVLDAFDDWRRAVGAGTAAAAGPGAVESDQAPASRKGSLAAHIARSVSRLLAPKAGPADPAWDARVGNITRELDELAAAAKGARGDARLRVIDRLVELDRDLMAGAASMLDAKRRAALQTEADAELSGLASRMPPHQLARARQLALERLVRDAMNLPVLSYE